MFQNRALARQDDVIETEVRVTKVGLASDSPPESVGHANGDLIYDARPFDNILTVIQTMHANGFGGFILNDIVVRRPYRGKQTFHELLDLLGAEYSKLADERRKLHQRKSR